MDLLTIIYILSMLFFSIFWFVLSYKNKVKKDTYFAVSSFSIGLMNLVNVFIVITKPKNFKIVGIALLIFTIINVVNDIMRKRNTNKRI